MADKLGTTTFDTIEEAQAYQAKIDKLDAALNVMTPAQRREYFANNPRNTNDILKEMDSD